MKFNLDDNVRSKELATEFGEGIIYGISKAYQYRTSSQKLGYSLNNWDKKYPNWHDKLLYYVEFKDSIFYTVPEDDLEGI